jgi:hypothetical protein
MFKKIITASILVVGAVAGSAFASSGYGPAPHYNPLAGAPASQRGVSVQTIEIETVQVDAGAQAYGGMSDMSSQSGSRITPAGNPGSLFAHH